MYSQRDIIIFLAGFEAFHTLSHIIIGASGILPLTFFSITWTQHLNIVAIIVNGLITVGLLWWVSRVK